MEWTMSCQEWEAHQVVNLRVSRYVSSTSDWGCHYMSGSDTPSVKRRIYPKQEYSSSSIPVDTLVEDYLRTPLFVSFPVKPRAHYMRSGRVEKGRSRPTRICLQWGDSGSRPCVVEIYIFGLDELPRGHHQDCVTVY